MTNQVFTSPEGELIFPYLNQPDTEFDSNGTYHTKIAVDIDDPATDAFVKLLENAVNVEYGKLDPKVRSGYTKRQPYELELDDSGEPTGRLIFKAKLAAHVTPRNGDAFSQQVRLFGDDLQPLEENIWGGTLALLRGQVVPYAMNSTKQVGVSLRLKAVKVTKLVTGSAAGSSWDSFGDADVLEDFEEDIQWS